jgi:transcriptional regulator with XRE-family HTH domain
MKLIIKNKKGELLKRNIYMKGINLREFANQIDITAPYLSRIINGKVHPSPKVAQKIVDNVGFDLSSVFKLKD